MIHAPRVARPCDPAKQVRQSVGGTVRSPLSMLPRKSFRILLLCASSASRATRAQTSAAAGRDSTARRAPDVALRTAPPADPAYTVWVAGTGHAPESNNPGSPNSRALVLAGVERSFPIAAGAWGRLTTSPALLPGVYTTHNYRGEHGACPVLTNCTVDVSYAAFGVGALPLALRYWSPSLGRVSVGLRGDAGGVYCTHSIPYSADTHFNFAAQYGGDLAVRATRRTSGVVGYRHLHLSNGGLGDGNPGIDARFITLGVQWH